MQYLVKVTEWNRSPNTGPMLLVGFLPQPFTKEDAEQECIRQITVCGVFNATVEPLLAGAESDDKPCSK